MLPTSISPTEIATIAAGFFFVMWIISVKRKKERRYYMTEIPSKLIIEREA